MISQSTMLLEEVDYSIHSSQINLPLISLQCITFSLGMTKWWFFWSGCIRTWFLRQCKWYFSTVLPSSRTIVSHWMAYLFWGSSLLVSLLLYSFASVWDGQGACSCGNAVDSWLSPYLMWTYVGFMSSSSTSWTKESFFEYFTNWHKKTGSGFDNKEWRDTSIDDCQKREKNLSGVVCNCGQNWPDPNYQPLRSGRIWHKVNF